MEGGKNGLINKFGCSIPARVPFCYGKRERVKNGDSSPFPCFWKDRINAKQPTQNIVMASQLALSGRTFAFGAGQQQQRPDRWQQRLLQRQ